MNLTMFEKIGIGVAFCGMSVAGFATPITLWDDDFSGSSTFNNGQRQEIQDGVAFGSTPGVHYGRAADSGWEVSGGVLQNTNTTGYAGTTAEQRLSEAGVALLIDLQSITNTTLDRISWEFDYTTTDPAEQLVIHIWGVNTNALTVAGSDIMNTGAPSGAMHQSSTTEYDVFNMQNDGFTNGPLGNHGTERVTLIGGAGHYSNGVTLSSLTTGQPGLVHQYDYLALGFARNLNNTGGVTTGVTIDNLSIYASSVPEPSSLAMLVLGCVFLSMVRRGKTSAMARGLAR